MSALIWIFIVWVPMSLIVTNIVNLYDGPITKWYKKVLFHIITFPVFWVYLLQLFVEKNWRAKWFINLARWFKS